MRCWAAVAVLTASVGLASAQVGEIFENLAAGQVGIERGLAGHVADEALDLQRLLSAAGDGPFHRPPGRHCELRGRETIRRSKH